MAVNLWVPDDNTARRLGAIAKRIGVTLRPLPTLEEWRAMCGTALLDENHDPGDEDRS